MKKLLFLLLGFTIAANAQLLTISSSGQTGTSGTNWSLTDNGTTVTITNTGTANINPSVIEFYLNQGKNVLVTNSASGTWGIHVRNSITKTVSGSSRLTLRSNGFVAIEANTSIKTTSGAMDIVLWADLDNSQVSGSASTDEINMNEGITIETKGGRLVMAGGLDDGANGGSANDGIPDNYAYRGASGLGGVNLGQPSVTGTVNSYITSGGDIIIRGWSRNSSNRPGIGSQGNLKIDAGSGRIDMQGIASVSHGIEFAYGVTPNIAINSSYSGSGPAIRLAGGAVNNNIGIYLANASGGNILIQSTSNTGGGVLIQGQNGTSNSYTAIKLLNSGSTTNLQILSGAGDIVVENSSVEGTWTSQGDIEHFGAVQYGSRLNTTAVQGITPAVASTNANVIIRGTLPLFETGTPITKVATTGKFTVEPKTGDDSFRSTVTFRNVDLTTVSNCRIGKQGNAQQVVIATDISVNGPISIYGGSFENIQINANITSTADGDILLQGENSTGWTARLNSAKSITKTAGTGSLIVHGTGRIGMDGTILASGSAKLNVILAAETDGGSTYGVSVKNITTNGGHVWIGGGSLTHTWNGLTVGSRWATSSQSANNNAIDIAGNISTSGGDVLMSAWSGWDQDIRASVPVSISTGSGNVTFLVNHSTFGSNKITINSTGKFSIAPTYNSDFGLIDLTVTGTTTSGNFTGSNDLNALVINNIANLQGLVLGNYFGTGKSGDTPYSYANTSITDISTAFNINGNIAVYGAGININSALTSAATGNAIQVIATGGNANLNANLTATGAGGSILTKATVDIVANALRTFQTNNGDFILWSDLDNNNSGKIQLGNSYVINTTNGSTTSGLSGGGRVVMAGGLDNGANGGIDNDGIPDGLTGGNTHGVLLGVDVNSNGFIYSGGGDIIMRGKSVVASGVGVYVIGKLTANAGKGSINMYGESSYFNAIQFNVSTATGTQLSLISDKASGDAIILTGISGTSAITGNDAVVFNNNGLKEILATGGGNISITGTTNNTNLSGIFLQNQDILATGGTITLNAGVRGFNFNSAGTRFGSKTGTAITNSSANVKLIANSFSPNATAVNTSGTLTLEPFSDSFTSALTYPISNLTVASTVSGLTIGKSTNISDVNFLAATSIAGPITVYGGKINVNANLTSTATTGSGVLLSGQKIEQAAGVNVTTSGANIDYTASNLVTTASNDYAIKLGAPPGTKASINAQGGSISLSGSYGSTGIAGEGDFAIWVHGTDIKTNNNGTINITGDATNTTTTGSSYGINLGSATLIQTEFGAISLTGTGGKVTSNSRGIVVDGQALSMLSSSGKITLKDLKPANLTGTYTGFYLRPSSTADIFIGSDGSTVLSGTSKNSSSDILIQSDLLTFVQNTKISNFNTAGKITFEPVSNSFGSALTFPITNLTIANSVSGLTLGKASNTANITFGSATTIAGPIKAYGGTIAVNGALTATNDNITLAASTAITQTAAITANGLALTGVGSATLTNTSNSINTIAGGASTARMGAINFINNKALTVGSVNPTGIYSSGAIEIATTSGDLLVTEPINSTLSTGDAIKLYADKDAVEVMETSKFLEMAL